MLEIQRMMELMQMHETNLIDVEYESGSIGTVVSAKAVKDGAKSVPITDFDSW
ncbi:hypothetical protein Aeh1ORF174c [Aeromonas phage Aeh1]|uniref:Uncharacterized protein n=1 Tax=Aeromonas phage Aeh1 TaxID=2880362 RepID=Q76YQ6_9CAUD|nr:hypothetical protein Aeh1p185 [Aeromonas phage Aeh1]AAQ17840.1 hypothetical protein Aeh1ORF174c [Aeromonas phage Aeh1]